MPTIEVALVDVLVLSDEFPSELLYEWFHGSGMYEGGVNIYGGLWFGESFTPSAAHDVARVRLKLRRVGSPGSVTVSIRATDGSGLPAGSDLCSAILDGNDLPLVSEWQTITFTTPYALLADTKYAIIVKALSGDVSNCIYMGNAVLGGYPGGQGVWTSNGGLSWSNMSADFLFEECGACESPLVSLDVAIADVLTLSDELNKIHLCLEDGLVFSDSPRIRLPYLHKPPQADDGYSLGDVAAAHSLGTTREQHTLGPVKGQQP